MDHSRAIEGNNIGSLGLDIVILVIDEVEHLKGFDPEAGIRQDGEAIFVEAVVRKIQDTQVGASGQDREDSGKSFVVDVGVLHVKLGEGPCLVLNDKGGKGLA